jgi:predicted kinase
MKTVYALSGRSGAGKTFRRRTDPDLKDLFCIDIADIYQEHPEADPHSAFSMMLEAMAETFEQGETFVVEARFRKDNYQRQWLDHFAEYYGYTVVYIEIDTPIDVCIERVKEDYVRDVEQEPTVAGKMWLHRYSTARLHILHSEQLDQILHDAAIRRQQQRR